jgi:hypothetical protein
MPHGATPDPPIALHEVFSCLQGSLTEWGVLHWSGWHSATVPVSAAPARAIPASLRLPLVPQSIANSAQAIVA